MRYTPGLRVANTTLQPLFSLYCSILYWVKNGPAHSAGPLAEILFQFVPEYFDFYNLIIYFVIQSTFKWIRTSISKTSKRSRTL